LHGSYLCHDLPVANSQSTALSVINLAANQIIYDRSA
jgi:hypothetical protein